jgi:hypothetical protein
MKVLKFRAWDSDNRMFVYLLISKGGIGKSVNQNDPVGELSDWQQFTGQLDKNCTEVYEGDIFGNLRGKRCFVGQQKDGAFKLFFLDKRMTPLSFADPRVKESVVIGNIYENPDLLKD